MKPHDQDERWAELLAALEPDATELAAAETALHEVEDAPPLGDARVAQMVAAATRPVTLSKVDAPQPSGPRRQFVRRLLLVAAALMFALPSVAWFLRTVKPTHSAETHTFGIALATLTEPGHNRDDKSRAAVTMYRLCRTAADLLKTLATDPDKTVRELSRNTRSSALSILNGQRQHQPQQVAGDLELSLSRARDTSLQPDVRVEAVGSVGAYLESGLSGLVSTTIDDPRIAEVVIRRLGKALRD